MKREKDNRARNGDGRNGLPNKMEAVAPKIVKLLKGYTISESQIALNMARDLIHNNSKC